MKRVFSIISSAILLAAISPAAGSDIVISGERDRTPAVVDIVPVSDADRQTKTLSEMLETRTGVQITRYGTAGSSSSIYVRGTNANQLAVYIDGIPLSDSVFGETNFENIPLDSLDRIEIYRSFAPLEFASPGIGGVVNLVTKKDRRATETGAGISAGSFSACRFTAFHSYEEKTQSLFVTGSASSIKGNFPFYNTNGTRYNSADDFNDTRKNNDARSGNATLRYSSREGIISIDMLCDLFVKDQGVASFNNNAESASLKTLRSMNTAKITIRRPGGAPVTEKLSVFINARRDTFDDLDNEIRIIAGKTTGTYLTYGAGSFTTVHLKDLLQEVSFSIQGQSEAYYLKKTSTADSKNYAPQKRSSMHPGIQDELSFFEGRLAFIPQLRSEIRHDSFSETSDASNTVYSFNPQAGVIFWPAADLIYMKSSCGINHRAPSFSELFGDRGTVQGNADLKDERSTAADITAGITYSDFSSPVVQSFRCEYSLFRTKIKNVIIFMQNSQNTMKAENISAASVLGHELSASMTVFNHLDLSAGGSIQFAKDESSIAYYKGNYLPHRPIFESNSSAKIFSGLGSISYQFSYTGANFRDRANSDSLYIKQRIYHTVSATWTPRYDITVSAEVKNISGNQTEDVAGYPLPGRSFTGSVQYIF